MKKNTTMFVGKFLVGGAMLLMFISNIAGSPVIRIASGANAAAIQVAVDQFRNDLGTLNPNNGQSFTSGRREINWDGVPDNFSSPTNLPPDFFNSTSPRGAVFTTACSAALFRVSSTTASGVPVRFGELDPSYTSTFTTFSAQRLFTVLTGTSVPCNILTISFFIPGTSIPATVRGFGIIFTDVDTTGNARIICYDETGALPAPGAIAPSAANNGLSFIGVSYNAGERISSCQIVSGPSRLASGNVDGTNGVDVVAMDDIIYGEPRAMQYHTADFDGDGTSDFSVFRPSSGTWFVLNSGTNTVTTTVFGQNGDLPIDADFDGDQRAEIAVWRPSSGTWFFKRSSDGTFGGVPWGQIGDKPVPGDYDKDGKTDFAVWRPSDSINYIIRSSDASFFGVSWGANGDIPLMGAGQ